MTAKLYIAIPVHNRLKIAAQCIPTVRGGMISGYDALAIYDDGHTLGISAEAERIISSADVCFSDNQRGIEVQRRHHFIDFARDADRFGWTHLYLTDSDAPHDPAFRSELLRLQDAHGGAPLCGYNTEAHARIPGNTVVDDPASEVIWRRVAPGVSYLLTRAHAAAVAKALPSLPDHWNWDWTVPAILGNRFAVTRQSVVSHIGWGGYHHPENEGIAGGDVPLNPTPWLVAKRAEIVAQLSQ